MQNVRLRFVSFECIKKETTTRTDVEKFDDVFELNKFLLVFFVVCYSISVVDKIKKK